MVRKKRLFIILTVILILLFVLFALFFFQQNKNNFFTNINNNLNENEEEIKKEIIDTNIEQEHELFKICYLQGFTTQEEINICKFGIAIESNNRENCQLLLADKIDTCENMIDEQNKIDSAEVESLIKLKNEVSNDKKSDDNCNSKDEEEQKNCEYNKKLANILEQNDLSLCDSLSSKEDKNNCQIDFAIIKKLDCNILTDNKLIQGCKNFSKQ